jgi:hypothetical protein
MWVQRLLRWLPRLLNQHPRRLHQQHVHRLHCRPHHKLLKPRLLPFSLRPLLPFHLLHNQWLHRLLGLLTQGCSLSKS